jgi:diadenosine tetraphosphate (Ap4A) HIT family hydrolase
MHTACPFCPPSAEQVVAQSPLTFTIRDGFPVSPGHTLIIPRRHFAGLFDARPEEITEIWRALRQAADDLTREHQPDGFNVGVNVGEAAGQTVLHLHVHLIPRYAGDQPDSRGGIRRIFPQRADYWSPRGK